MAIKPVARYILLCDDWQLDSANDQRITIIGLISNIRALDDPPYPLFYRELCVFLVLTGGYGQGQGKIICRYEDTGEPVFQSLPRVIPFGSDRLEIVGVSFRIRNCTFPQAGLYSVEFWYEEELIAEQPLRMR